MTLHACSKEGIAVKMLQINWIEFTLHFYTKSANLYFTCFSFSVVFQVYEQLYDTLDIVGGPEVRAQATAKVWAISLPALLVVLHCTIKRVRADTQLL